MIKLYNDDCMNVFKEIESESIDLFITDCPYHIISGGCTNDAVKIGRYRETSGILQHRYVSDDESITWTRQGKLFKHNEIEFEEWLPEVYRILKPNTHCYIMINPRNLKELWQKAEEAGFVFQNLLVWDKGNTTPNKWYMQAYELILMLRKGKAKNINVLGTKNILRIPNITRKKLHPTEKPVELMKILVENSSKENETVMDAFMGVGGVGVACKALNRNFIGCEIDENYFNIAKDRMEPKQEDYEFIQMSLFEFIKEKYEGSN